MKKKKTMKDNIMKGVRNLFRIKRENEATKTEILKTFLNQEKKKTIITNQ